MPKLMPVSGSIDELSDLIARLELVSLGDLRTARDAGDSGTSEQEFLDLLQRRHLLTGYQVEKLLKRETGGLVVGGCKLLYRNAAGSFARVYRGCMLSDNSMVGIKVLRDRWASDADTIKLFHREGELGRRLKHPGIVPIYSVGQDGDAHYITMEFVEGGNFRDFLKIRGKLDPIETCRHALSMSEALEYALSQGISHRDLKLTNVLMSSQGKAKLIDFGLGADDSGQNRIDNSDLQQALEYSTLEKGSGALRNDPRSDLYFLGTIIYELLTGVPPYPRTKDREERKRFSRYRDIRPVTSIDPRVPHKVADIVDRLLHTNAELRYQRPAEVAADLRSALGTMNSPVEEGRDQPASGGPADPPKVLCVESRPKHQDLLREYFSKRGFRVLLLSDLDRAAARIAQNPPDCLVVMGDAAGDDLATGFEKALDADPRRTLGGVLVLSEKQGDIQAQVEQSVPRGHVLKQPISLRALRHEIESVLRKTGRSLPESPGGDSTDEV